MQFQPNTQDFSGNNPQYVFSDYQAPPEDCTHVAVAWFDIMGNLQTRGIGKRRLVEKEIDHHWTQEWQSKGTETQRRTIARAIRNRQAHALTDGSYKERGSAGYSITDYQQTTLRGACRIPGTWDVQSAYQSELVGLLATLIQTKNCVMNTTSNKVK